MRLYVRIQDFIVLSEILLKLLVHLTRKKPILRVDESYFHLICILLKCASSS